MLSIDELVKQEELDRKRLVLWIERRWVLPVREGDTWLFDEADLARALLIRDLCQDMEIDDETVPMVLSLIDQIHELRVRLRTVMEAIEAQPEAVRQRILDRLDQPDDA